MIQDEPVQDMPRVQSGFHSFKSSGVEILHIAPRPQDVLPRHYDPRHRKHPKPPQLVNELGLFGRMPKPESSSNPQPLMPARFPGTGGGGGGGGRMRTPAKMGGGKHSKGSKMAKMGKKGHHAKKGKKAKMGKKGNKAKKAKMGKMM